MKKVNLKQKFKLFNEHWHPHILAELNQQEVKIAKLKGEFIWHKHKNEDELFLVIKGTLQIALRDKTVTLKKNEFLVVPKGVEHKPIAKKEVHVLLFEPKGTLNTGNKKSKLSRRKLNTI
ncbi:MAG: cupin domain-containing protein [Bacteroidia bacterium]|nr:cupin domain-containing protein [Bacteroidia bacterium]